MTREKFMISLNSIRAGIGALKTAAILTLLSSVAACTAGGPATTTNQAASSGGSTAQDYTGPAPRNADVQAFKNALWVNIHTSDKCGGCHNSTVGQAPEFARSDDVNQAYDAAVPLVNFTQPDQSTLVLRVKSGHNCWLSDPNSCGDIMLQWINAWIGTSASSSSSTPPLQTPPSSTVSGGKQFPTSALTEGSSPPDSFKETVYPLLAKFCSGCHTASASVPQTPYFATGGTPGVDVSVKPPLDSDVEIAYQAAQAKINLNSPDQSRFYQRLHDDHHNCWDTGTPQAPNPGDCTGSAAAMLAAITAFANGLTIQQVDTSLVLSKALALKQGTLASGGNRADANVIAKYEFKTGTGTTAFDTSGVTPSADLQLTGPVSWAGGWGINIAAGGSAKALTATSAKLANMITAAGEFSIEAWVAPANVTQANAWIVSYSGSDKTRNVTLGQQAMQYSGATRSDKTDANGGTKPIMPDATKFPVQAALQHVVLTYDPVNGQKLYINGVDTGAKDPSAGGSLASWDNTFALVLGAETTGKEQWLGTIKFVAIHSRALTSQQVMQNFNAGVGEKYFLLFDVSDLTGVAQSYIQVTGFVLDSYAYQFMTPTFQNLNPNAAIGTIPIKGIRVGVNGVELPTGQSYSTVNTNITASGQVLSPVGAVIAADKGPDGATPDMFFLTFEQIGTHTHAHTDPITLPTTPTFPTVAPSRKGVKNFAQVNNALSVITGVPVNTPAVNTLYNTLQQSLPPTNDLGAFLSSHQTAISAMADQYCNIAVNDTSGAGGSPAMFPGLTLTQPAATYFSVQANRDLLINPLVAQAIGTNVNPAMEAAVRTEINSFLTTLSNGQTAAGRTASIAQAACTAVLGSAVVSLQ
jgi:hypothetical protein